MATLWSFVPIAWRARPISRSAVSEPERRSTRSIAPATPFASSSSRALASRSYSSSRMRLRPSASSAGGAGRAGASARASGRGAGCERRGRASGSRRGRASGSPRRRSCAREISGLEWVLEVGTGSGYQTAILAELAGFVVTTERIPALAGTAEKLLASLGYTNIEVHLAGEVLGWRDKAPYDAMMVTAGAPRVPADLLAQLAIGGRMVIPVGSRYVQELCKVTRRRSRNVVENLGGCRFVSLIGRGAWEENEGG